MRSLGGANGDTGINHEDTEVNRGTHPDSWLSAASNTAATASSGSSCMQCGIGKSDPFSVMRSSRATYDCCSWLRGNAWMVRLHPWIFHPNRSSRTSCALASASSTNDPEKPRNATCMPTPIAYSRFNVFVPTGFGPAFWLHHDHIPMPFLDLAQTVAASSSSQVGCETETKAMSHDESRRYLFSLREMSWTRNALVSSFDLCQSTEWRSA